VQTIALTAAADANPAGGSAAWEAILASAVAIVVTLAVLLVAWAHRSGRIKFLAAAGAGASRATGLPAWAALPSMITAVSLIVALVGMYWDISLHIADGRDAGPFANPAHFLILFGLFGVFISGLCAIVLPEGRPGRSAIRISGDWYAPLGGIGLLAASAFALTGFPLDDFWHRIFGQDVTLWGPTHLMMIGGAALAFIGQATLLSEARLSEREPDRSSPARARIAELARRLRMPALMGGFLIGLCTFQAEFDFGVPQFRMLFAPVLIAVAAGIGLVAARIYGGRGMALYAVAFFVAIRGGLALLVGPILGEPTPHFPLFIAEALLIEGVALAIAVRERPYVFGAVAGLAVGTVGFAAEYAWSHVWMPVPWQPALIGEALLPTVIAAVAAGLVGAFIASAWRAPLEERPVGRIRVAPAVAGLLVVVAVIGYGLRTSPDTGIAADVRLTEVSPDPQREVAATVRLDPPDAAANAEWLNVTSWQGGGLRVDELEQVGDGVYRTTAPLPVYGNWKSLIRLQSGDSITGVPIYLPEDTAIPAPGIPARSSFERPFIPDKEILQREQLDDVPGWTEAAGYAVVGSIVAAIVLMLGWILARLAASNSQPPPARSSTRRRRLGRVGAASGTRA